MEQPILLLGDPTLYEISQEVREQELPLVQKTVEDLHDTILAYRRKMGTGRAIAAPQIGTRKRIVYMHIEKPVVFVNPRLEFPDDEMLEVLDDCMSFPHLYVRVKRHRRCVIRYKDMRWNDRELCLEDDLSELLQHECDHLDGILATMRAVDDKAFLMKERGTPRTE